MLVDDVASQRRQQVKLQDRTNSLNLLKKRNVERSDPMHELSEEIIHQQMFVKAQGEMNRGRPYRSDRQMTGKHEEISMQQSSKMQLQQQVFELQSMLNQKDKLISLMTAEIQNLRWNLQKETEQSQLLRQQLFDANIIDDENSEPSELMIEETKRDKQTMMFAVSTGRAAKNAQRLRKNGRSEAQQVMQAEAMPEIQVIPSASPSSQPVQVAQQSQLIGLVNIQDPPHEQRRRSEESAPQSSRSSNQNMGIRHNSEYAYLQRPDLEEQKVMSSQKNQPFHTTERKNYGREDNDPKQRKSMFELDEETKRMPKTHKAKSDFGNDGQTKRQNSPMLKREDNSSSDSSRDRGQAKLKIKRRESNDSYLTARSHPITSPKIPNVEFENVYLDNPSQKVIASDSPRMISKRNNSITMGEESYQTESLNVQEQQLSSLIQPTRLNQGRRMEADTYPQMIYMSSSQQMIDEHGMRNVVRNSMNNRRTRDEVVEHASQFGMRKPGDHSQYGNRLNQRMRTPIQAQPIPQLNRVGLNDRMPNQPISFQQSHDKDEETKSEKAFKEMLLESLIGGGHSQDNEQLNRQRINQLLKSGNGYRDEERKHRMQEDQDNSFEHENENNQFTTNESILINKVNEMQIKTSRFDNPRSRHLLDHPPRRDDQVHSQDEAIFHELGMSQHQRTTQRHILMTYVQHMQNQNQVRLGNNNRRSQFEARNLDYNMNEMLGDFGARVGAQASEEVQRQIQTQQVKIIQSSRQNRAVENIPANHNLSRSHPSNQPPGQLNHLNIQRPCEQLPPSNIRGDVQSHIDAEEFNQNVEGVSGGLVPQQRIPLPNQQHQQLPRAPSQDSFVNDPGEQNELDEQLAMAIESSRENYRNQLSQHHQQSMDDIGMDEFDVADERAHLFGEQINPDIMTYEQLLALQERIGYVNKGMTVQEMDRFPKMKFAQLKKIMKEPGDLKIVRQQSENLIDQEEIKIGNHRKNSAQIQQERNGQKAIEGERSNRVQFDNRNQPNQAYIAVRKNKTQQFVYVFEGEESKSQRDNESNKDKSSSSVLSFPNEISVQDPSDFDLSSSRQIVREQRDIQRFLFNSHPVNSVNSRNNRFEEAKADLENAAPEQHHPREEVHLNPLLGQRIKRSSQQDLIRNPNMESLNEEQEEGGDQEDVFDEGDDISNRKMPHLVNINGSIPNQHPLQGIVLFDQNLPKRKPSLSQAQALIAHEESKLSASCQAPRNVSLHDPMLIEHIKQARKQLSQSMQSPHKHPSARQSDRSVGLSSQMSSTVSDVCIICQYHIKSEDTVKLIQPCNHYFHVNCVNQWLLVEKKCPLCMTVLP